MSAPARTGSTTGNRAPVLRQPIPRGGFGRALTSTEVRDLRDLGWSCSTSQIVVRQVSDLDHLGIVYRPTPRRLGGGYTHTGCYVALLDRR